MSTINLILGVHNHQPVGNFDHVIAESHEKAYLPFLEAVERHPSIPFTFHNTGILLDWYAERKPEYIDRLRSLVALGQAEVLGGGFYEPILPVIPEADILGQIEMMNDEVERLFGVRPRGMWLAERVWEPQLPRHMEAAGIQFATLDDSHFKCAGLSELETLGYYMTEDSGRAVAVFPINQKLRYTIPFRDPEESIEYLRSLATEDGKRLVVMADDGEKFGSWPGTHEHCYTEGWLERFLTALEDNSSWIRVIHFSDALERLTPLGRVYLPTASYTEMMEWALPANAVERYEDFVESLEETRNDFDNERMFVRAGFWRNFLAKYDEGNHIHKRMIRVSEKLHRALETKPHSKRLLGARRALWQAQCNCAYWHGVFGGLYLPHLRSALYRCLIEAEKLIGEVTHRGGKWLDFDRVDFDCDGHDELLVETPAHICVFKPSAGGMMVEHDLLDQRFNAIDLLGRRKEGYHRRVIEADRLESQEGGDAGAEDSHDHVTAKEAGLDRLLHYDWHRRGCFVDHFIDPGTSMEQFSESRQREDGDFANQAYVARTEKRANDFRVTFERLGGLYRDDGRAPLRVTKVLTISPDLPRIDAEYTITNEGDWHVATRFGVEFGFNFLAADAPDRYYRINNQKAVPPRLAGRGAEEEARRFAIVDEWLKVEARVTPDEPMELWRFPLETVSLSEGGFERVYQGSILLAHTMLELGSGDSRTLGFRYEVLPHPAE